MLIDKGELWNNMRLIDADILDKALTALRFTADGELAHWGDRKDWCLHGSEVETLIADAPTVDAVPVVRCKDCKWWKTNYSWSTGEYKVCVREAYEPMREDEDFCSRGERRDEDEND